MPVGRGKDGVPTWDGEPASWPEYRRAALLYLEGTKWENRYLCGPRLAAELTGSARSSIANKRPAWLSSSDGVHKLLRHLQGAISEPVLPEVGNALRTYFRQLRRKRGETMTSFTVRHREEYEKACRALTRMVSGQASDLSDRTSRTTSRRGSWSGLGLRRSNIPGPEQRPEQGITLEEDHARGSLDGSTTADHTEEDPWTTWYRDEERRAWAARGWVEYGATSGGNAASNGDEDSDHEEQLVEILPDVVKGWLLLDKAGLDSLERGIIQSDIKSQFSLAAVESSLRAHWTDDQVRARDGQGKQQANFEDWDESEEEDMILEAEESFEGWSQDDVALFQAAQDDERASWMQIQEGRRTLKDARARQKEVRLGRRFFASKGKGRGGKDGRKPASDVQGPCLRCGRAHATRNCPHVGEKDSKPAMMTEESSEFVYQANEEITLFGEHGDPDTLLAGDQKMTTQQAMKAGYGVLDAGATKTMGSITALQHVREAAWRDLQQDNIEAVDTQDQPTFGFADSESAKCSSTCLVQLPVESQQMKLRVHALDRGQVPILLSIDTLKKLGAIVDYGRNEAVFLSVDPRRCVKLETTVTGHQILPLTKDFMKQGYPLKAAVSRIGHACE